jgi:hypothetical protein
VLSRPADQRRAGQSPETNRVSTDDVDIRIANPHMDELRVLKEVIFGWIDRLNHLVGDNFLKQLQ